MMMAFCRQIDDSEKKRRRIPGEGIVRLERHGRRQGQTGGDYQVDGVAHRGDKQRRLRSLFVSRSIHFYYPTYAIIMDFTVVTEVIRVKGSEVR